MGLADLHIHTIHSWDGTSTVSAVLRQARDVAHLDVVAITDHDTLAGVCEAKELAPGYGLDVVPGIEITTAGGHLLALYIEEMVPPGLPLRETVLRVGDLGGICIAPHPTAKGRRLGIGAHALRGLLAEPQIARILVGVEAFNGGLLSGASNISAALLVESLDVARVASSDAHLVWAVGTGATAFTGKTAAQLRLALENHATTMRIRNPITPWLGSLQWLRLRLLRSMGWVTTDGSPYAGLRLSRQITGRS